MLSERDIEQAHPEAFDFVFGNLPSAKRAEFNRHLTGCRYCQAVVDEYSEIGRIIKQPSPARRAASRPRRPDRRRHGRRPRRAEGQPERRSGRRGPRPPPGPTRFPGASLRLSPRPRSSRSPAPASAETRPARHRPPTSRHRPSRKPGRWSLACRCGDVTEAAWPLSPPPPLPSSLPPSSSRSAFSAAGPPRSPSRFCHHGGQGERLRSSHRARDGPPGCLRQLEYHPDRASPQELRGCQVVRMLVRQPQHRQVASAGTFLVPDSGSGTFSMTSAVDPHDFSTMEITIGPPNNTGALSGTVILSGQAL